MSEQNLEPKLGNATFKNNFFLLSKYLGGNARTLHEHLGKYDEIDEDEHRAYVWFKNTKASFYVGNDDIVGWVSAPKSNAYGNTYLDEPDYFTIDGIKQGMSKNDVERLWGQPDWKANLVWGYMNRGSITNSGQKFELCVQFRENNYDYQVSHFESRIPKDETQPIVTSSKKFTGSIPILVVLSILALIGVFSGNIFLLLVFGISAGAYWWSKFK